MPTFPVLLGPRTFKQVHELRFRTSTPRFLGHRMRPRTTSKLRAGMDFRWGVPVAPWSPGWTVEQTGAHSKRNPGYLKPFDVCRNLTLFRFEWVLVVGGPYVFCLVYSNARMLGAGRTADGFSSESQRDKLWSWGFLFRFHSVDPCKAISLQQGATGNDHRSASSRSSTSPSESCLLVPCLCPKFVPHVARDVVLESFEVYQRKLMSFIRFLVNACGGNLVPSGNPCVNLKECKWAIAVKEELKWFPHFDTWFQDLGKISCLGFGWDRFRLLDYSASTGATKGKSCEFPPLILSTKVRVQYGFQWFFHMNQVEFPHAKCMELVYPKSVGVISVGHEVTGISMMVQIRTWILSCKIFPVLETKFYLHMWYWC